MKISIIGLNYLPESTSIGPYTAELAEHLRDRGHEVRVVTGFPSAPNWEIWHGYRKRKFMREVINGVPVFRTYLYVPKNPRRAMSRILFDSVFAVSALTGIFAQLRPDLIIVISPPLQLAITGRLLAALSRARVFLHIKDLVPDAAVATGALREGSIAWKLGRALEAWAYRGATGVGVICDGMRRNLLAKGVPATKVKIFPDYIDPTFIQPVEGQHNNFRAKFGISADAFLVMYSGSVSSKQGLETYVEAAEVFETDHKVVCCLIGDGANLGDLKTLAAARSMRRFLFVPLQPRESLAAQLSAADVLVITQRKLVTDIVFPGKLLYYMSSGTAMLAAVHPESETGRFIREHQVGMVVPPEDPSAFAAALRWMREHPEERREFGRNGRRVIETQFDRSLVLGRFGSHLEQVGARGNLSSATPVPF
ncbi:MAG: WcaI family glycosyltransferase [Bryobacterales bacterium]|nr:WcaI family glycosyltransferase [Bryobacterales bacterium]